METIPVAAQESVDNIVKYSIIAVHSIQTCCYYTTFFFVSIAKQSHSRLLKYKHVPMFIRLTMAGDEMTRDDTDIEKDNKKDQDNNGADDSKVHPSTHA